MGCCLKNHASQNPIIFAIFFWLAACPAERDGEVAVRVGERLLESRVLSERTRINTALGASEREIAALADLILSGADGVAGQYGYAMTEVAVKEHYRLLLEKPNSPLSQWASEARDNNAFLTAAVLPSLAFQNVEHLYENADGLHDDVHAMRRGSGCRGSRTLQGTSLHGGGKRLR
jgi:hypothetical protein